MVRRRVVVPRPKVKPAETDQLRHTMTISNRGQHLLSMLHSFHKLSIAELIMALLNLGKLVQASNCKILMEIPIFYNIFD